jgi:hypothetical protein
VLRLELLSVYFSCALRSVAQAAVTSYDARIDKQEILIPSLAPTPRVNGSEIYGMFHIFYYLGER